MEWAAAKQEGRGERGWKKLPLGIDGITGAVASLTADAAHDTIAFYTVAAARGARVVVPQSRRAGGRGTRVPSVGEGLAGGDCCGQNSSMHQRLGTYEQRGCPSRRCYLQSP